MPQLTLMVNVFLARPSCSFRDRQLPIYTITKVDQKEIVAFELAEVLCLQRRFLTVLAFCCC